MGLTLVRHTQPDIPEGICYGHTDLPLAKSFTREAALVLEKLPRADVLVSSPLQRCSRLADAIGAARDLPVILDDRLREMSFGSWEGQAWDDIPRAELDCWSTDFYTARTHGGDSVSMLHKRVHSAVQDYRRTGLSHIVVCHAGVIKAAFAKGTTAEDFSTHLPFGGVLELTLHTDPTHD